MIDSSLLDLGNSDTAFLLAALTQVTTTPPTPQQILCFRRVLEQKIIEEMQIWFEEECDLDEPLTVTREEVERCSFTVDYHPEGLLYEAAETAGLDQIAFRFPCKTRMDLKRGQVRVQEGAGTGWKTIYPQAKGRVKHILETTQKYCEECDPRKQADGLRPGTALREAEGVAAHVWGDENRTSDEEPWSRQGRIQFGKAVVRKLMQAYGLTRTESHLHIAGFVKTVIPLEDQYVIDQMAREDPNRLLAILANVYVHYLEDLGCQLDEIERKIVESSTEPTQF